MNHHEPGTDGHSSASELARLLARQRELVRTTDGVLASLAAVRASRTYRLDQHLQRLLGQRAEAAEPARRDAVRAEASADSPHPPDAQLIEARETTARLEAELRRLERDLHAATRTPLRRLRIEGPRRLAAPFRPLRHPLWFCAAALRVAGNAGPLAPLRAAWRRLFWNTALCRLMPVLDQSGGGEDDGAALRWLPPLRISGVTRHALFAHPPTSVAYRVQAPGRARVVADCGVMPQVWRENCDGVEFDLEVSAPAGQWHASRILRLDPAVRQVDRRWRTLALDLPANVEGDLIVRLTTRLPGNAGNGHAWGVWGEPRIEWRKTSAQTRRTVAGLAALVRRTGLRGALSHVRAAQASDEEAERYRQWVGTHTPDADELARLKSEGATFAYRPRISVITPVYNTDPRWLRACIESVRRQAYGEWELCLADDGSTAPGTLALLREYAGDPRIRIVHLAANAGISAASNAALEQATGEFVALLDHDDELAPEALVEMVRLLNREPDADMIYSDEDKLDEIGERCDPYFKPDWSPEHFRSCMYTCHLMVVRTSLVRELGGFRLGFEGSQDYDLVLRVMERTSRIHHVPAVLYRWRKIEGSVAASGLAKTWAIDAGERALQDHVARAGLDAVVVPGPTPGLYRVRYRIAGTPLVSIVIPTDGRSREIRGRTVDLLTNCVKSILQKTTYEHFEIVIADNGRLPDATVAFLSGVPHRRVHFSYSGAFNYARKLNFAVSHTKGSQLLLLNDDIEVITPEWIEAMLEFSQQEPIGAVGAKLYYPDGRLQHIGVVMGVSGMAAHAFHSHPGSTVGYGSSAMIVRNYSAVTAACMMTRRALYERLAGFDERFAFDFNDTDYCLRLRREGFRIVFTPHAELYHLESATFGARTWNAPDLESMRERWAGVCERDPYYNPHLTRDFPDYRVRV